MNQNQTLKIKGEFFSITLQNVPTKVLYFKKIDLHTRELRKKCGKPEFELGRTRPN